MPLYFNTKPLTIRAKLVDGTVQAFPPRVVTHVSRHNISSEVMGHISRKSLVFRGDDHRDVIHAPAKIVQTMTQENVFQGGDDESTTEPDVGLVVNYSGTDEQSSKVPEPETPAELDDAEITKESNGEGDKRKYRRRK